MRHLVCFSMVVWTAAKSAQQESGKAVDASDTASLGGAEDAQDLRWPVYTLADAGDGGGWGAWDATRIGCSRSKTDSDNKKPKERMRLGL